MATDNLTQDLTRALASDDFDGVLRQLPAVQADIDRCLREAASDSEREIILAEALRWNGRWLALAHSLKADLTARLRGLQAEASYAETADGPPLFETLG